MAWRMKKASNPEQELLWQLDCEGYIKYAILTMESKWGWSREETFATIIDLEAKGLCGFYRVDPEETTPERRHLRVKASELSLPDIWEDWWLVVAPTELTRKRLAEVGGYRGFFDREEVE